MGIRRRRTVLPLDYIRSTHNRDPRGAEEAALYDNAATAARAAAMALERAGVAAAEIGLVVSGGCYPDMAIPADASRVAAAAGISTPRGSTSTPPAAASGRSCTCWARWRALPRFVLVVNPENTTRAIDYSDRANAVLWGDGTSAAVLSSREAAPVRVVASTLGADSKRWDAVRIPRHGHFFQEGNAVQRFAIKTTISLVREMLPEACGHAEAAGGTLRFIGHQANLLMLQGVARRAGLDGESHWHNVAEFGNTGAAGAPVVLSQRWDELASGDSLILAVVGSGLTWSSLRIEVC